MKNIALSLDEQLHAHSRAYATAHHTTLNALVRTFLRQTVSNTPTCWSQECLELMDDADGHSQGTTWTRDDLYEPRPALQWRAGLQSVS